MRVVHITYDERRAMVQAAKPGSLVVEPDHPESFWFVGVPYLQFVVSDEVEA